MDRISFDRHSGEEIEHFIAMLVYREHETSTQIRPSRGDGGLDIIDPIDADTYNVYQVKCYSKNLNSRQKNKIEESLQSVLKYTKEKSIALASWIIAMPLAPTPENLEWIRSLSKTHNLPIRWMGLDAIDALHAKYPDVANYYFFGGKNVVSDNFADLLAAVKGINRAESGGPLTMEEYFSYGQHLQESLNLDDPHYRYEIHVTESVPTTPNDPLHAAQRTHKLDNSRTAVLNIFARCKGSFIERPIDRRLTIRRGKNPPIDTAFDDFIQYGSPVELPPGTYELRESLPIEIPEPFQDTPQPTGNLLIGMQGPNDTHGTWVTFSVGDAENPFITEHNFRMAPPTEGPSGTGMRRVGKNANDTCQITLSFDKTTQQVHLTFKLFSLIGKRPDDLLDILEFLASLKGKRTLYAKPKYGNSDRTIFHEIPDDLLSASYEKELNVVKYYQFLQSKTSDDIFIPDPDAITSDEERHLASVTAILQNQIFIYFGSGPLFTIQSDPEDSPINTKYLFIRCPLIATLGGTKVNFGDSWYAIERDKVRLDPVSGDGPDDLAQLTATEECNLYWAKSFPDDWDPPALN